MAELVRRYSGSRGAGTERRCILSIVFGVILLLLSFYMSKQEMHIRWRSSEAHHDMYVACLVLCGVLGVFVIIVAITQIIIFSGAHNAYLVIYTDSVYLHPLYGADFKVPFDQMSTVSIKRSGSTVFVCIENLYKLKKNLMVADVSIATQICSDIEKERKKYLSQNHKSD